VDDDDARGTVQGAIVRRFPNVSVLDLTHIQGVVDDVFGRVSLAIRFLAAFTLAAGLAVLAAAAVASRQERVRESVLLRTIGATSAQLRGILLTESMALGVVGADALRERARQLGGDWTPARVEQALWSHAGGKGRS
jgi:putative ABC transport system permease protein